MIAISLSFLSNFSSNWRSCLVMLWMVTFWIWKPFSGGMMIVATPGLSHFGSAFSSACSWAIRFLCSWLRRTVLFVGSYSRMPCLVSVSQCLVRSSREWLVFWVSSESVCQAPSSRHFKRVFIENF